MCIDQDTQTCFNLVHDGGGDLLLHVFRTDCLSNLFRRSAKFRTTLRSHRKHGHDSLLYNNDVLQLLEQSHEFRQKCENDPTILNNLQVCTSYFTSEQSSSVCARPDVRPQHDPQMTTNRNVFDSIVSPVVCSRDSTTNSPDPPVNAPAPHPALASSATRVSMPVIPAHGTTSVPSAKTTMPTQSATQNSSIVTSASTTQQSVLPPLSGFSTAPILPGKKPATIASGSVLSIYDWLTTSPDTTADTTAIKFLNKHATTSPLPTVNTNPLANDFYSNVQKWLRIRGHLLREMPATTPLILAYEALAYLTRIRKTTLGSNLKSTDLAYTPLFGVNLQIIDLCLAARLQSPTVSTADALVRSFLPDANDWLGGVLAAIYPASGPRIQYRSQYWSDPTALVNALWNMVDCQVPSSGYLKPQLAPDVRDTPRRTQ